MPHPLSAAFCTVLLTLNRTFWLVRVQLPAALLGDLLSISSFCDGWLPQLVDELMALPPAELTRPSSTAFPEELYVWTIVTANSAETMSFPSKLPVGIAKN